jgi:hypothetical protein
VTNPEDTTGEECVAVDGCSAAVRADEISIYRFENQEDAANFADGLGENDYQSDWVVLEYPGAKLDANRAVLSYSGLIDDMWTSD